MGTVRKFRNEGSTFIYKKYPLLREAINRRSIVYNQQLEQVERMEAAGEIVVIRPQKPVVVDRIERDIKKLTELYEEGYRCAEHFAFRFDSERVYYESWCN